MSRLYENEGPDSRNLFDAQWAGVTATSEMGASVRAARSSQDNFDPLWIG